MPKVSIIIPIYNTKDYLKECLDSAINQTLQDIEILLVDDGSTDGSERICDEYGEMDSRVRVIHKQNGGVCDARNVGMREVRADYFTFLESDDWLPKDAVEKIYEKAIEVNSDFVFGGYYKVVTSGNIFKKPLPSDCSFDAESIKNELLPNIIGLTGAQLKNPANIDTFLTDTAKLYKTDIVRNNHIEWISRKEIYSDCLDFIMRYVSSCNDAIYINEPIYYYRRTNENSQTAAYRNRTIELWNVQFDSMEKFIKQNNLDNLYPAFYSRICFSIIPIGGNAYRMRNRKAAIKEIKKALSNPIYKRAFENFELYKLKFYFIPLFWFAKHHWYIAFYEMTVIMRKLMNRQRGI